MKTFLLAICICFAMADAGADTLVHNVRGYTLNRGELQRFVALEFNQGKVTRLYQDPDSARASPAVTRIDGAGATLLPGLIDAHGHVSKYGRALATVSLLGAGNEQVAAGRVAAYLNDHLNDHADADWVQGRGWNQVLWPGKAFPTRTSLDAVADDRALVLERVDGHALWVNSRTLELAGITADTPDPEGGHIERDDRGEPTGILVDNAMKLVRAVMPGPSVKQLATWQHAALEDLARYGLTSVHDAGITAREVQAYRNLQRDGNLPVRVYAMLDVNDPENERHLKAGPSLDAAERLVIRSVKLSADGALGSRGAALIDDYADDPGNRGLLLLAPDVLERLMRRSATAGFQVNTHAIGDRANALVLDIYARLNRNPQSAGLRHRVEHAQILRPGDIPRFPLLGVIASVQPTHATSDKNMAGSRLGESRLVGAYAWKSLLQSGAELAGGSDFPIESPNPFFGIHAAVTRQDHRGEPAGGWLPAQKLSREAALALFTEGAAWSAHQEATLGRLQPGYFADFILVNDDPFTVPAEQLWQLRVLATYVAGKQVYTAP